MPQYREIAVPLFDGEHGETSLQLLLAKLEHFVRPAAASTVVAASLSRRLEGVSLRLLAALRKTTVSRPRTAPAHGGASDDGGMLLTDYSSGRSARLRSDKTDVAASEPRGSTSAADGERPTTSVRFHYGPRLSRARTGSARERRDPSQLPPSDFAGALDALQGGSLRNLHDV